jgi:O-acetyl-ADP-ribose deacetylase (regulator of RNase III)
VGFRVEFKIIEGDLLEQPVDVIVNSWNRNILPWWLLLPQGVSGAIKRKAGLQPFWELARLPMIPLGGAVATSAGRLPYKAIIHVAGINLVWRSSKNAISRSVTNAVKLADEKGFTSIALPVIGAGSGGFNAARSEKAICETLRAMSYDINVILVKYKKPA